MTTLDKQKQGTRLVYADAVSLDPYVLLTWDGNRYMITIDLGRIG